MFLRKFLRGFLDVTRLQRGYFGIFFEIILEMSSEVTSEVAQEVLSGIPSGVLSEISQRVSYGFLSENPPGIASRR